MTHKKFGQQSENTAETPEPITFDVAHAEGITCRRRVNGKLLIELVGKVDSGNVALQAEGILQVFEVCVLTNDGENAEDYTGKYRHSDAELADAEADGITPGIDPTSSLARLRDVLDDPNTEIAIDELAEMVGWLVEQYTGGRPTKNAGASRNGAGSTNRSSRRARRSQGGTGEPRTLVSSSTSSTEPS